MADGAHLRPRVCVCMGPNSNVKAKSACINFNFKLKFFNIGDSLRILRPLTQNLFVNTIQKVKKNVTKPKLEFLALM